MLGDPGDEEKLQEVPHPGALPSGLLRLKILAKYTMHWSVGTGLEFSKYWVD